MRDQDYHFYDDPNSVFRGLNLQDSMWWWWGGGVIYCTNISAIILM